MSFEPPGLPAEPPERPIPPYPPRPAFGATILQPALRALRSGWGHSALAAFVVLAAVFLLNLALAWLQLEATERILPYGEAGLATPVDYPGIGRTALTSMMLWHGVALDVGIPLPAGDIPFGTSIEASGNVTLLLGFAMTGYLLYRAGKWAAERRGQAGWLSGTSGIQIALLYGVFMLLVGFGAGTSFEIPNIAPGEPAPSVGIQPSMAGAFGMPFLLAAFAAGAGALAGRLSPRERTRRLVLAAVSGGWRAAWLAVALASIGFLIVAALNPDVTRAYLELLPGGALSRFLLIISTLLVVPNVGTGIAAAAMGGSINLAALGDSCAVISYMQFPSGAEAAGPEASCGLPFALGPAPFQYLLFLLVPLAATFAGGWLAAQRSGAKEAEDGAIAGAAIALPYALGLFLIALVARVGYTAGAGFFPLELRFWIGPGLLSTVLLALVWGLAGGAIGGAFGARKSNGPGTSPGPPDSVSS